MTGAAKRHAEARVFIVDDHPIVRNGLREMIEQEPGLLVCGEAGTAAQALREVEAASPDVAIVDLSLGDSNGIDLIKDLRRVCGELPILVLSMHEEALYVERALKAGAKGYVTKDALTSEMLEAVKAVLQGRFYLDEAMSSKMLSRFAATAAEADKLSVEFLTDRELEVFGLIGRGFGTREIAQRLHLSARTVGAHREHIKAKLGIGSGEELLRSAISWVHR